MLNNIFMITNLVTGIRKFFSDKEKKMNKYNSYVSRINAMEPELTALSDQQLAEEASQLKKNYSAQNYKSTLVRAFAVAREAARRILNMRHYDVQLIGGMILFDGMIAEMYTGEGKTIVATLAAFMNYITGQRTIIATVNDYLVYRDSNSLKPLYNFLGMKVGTILEKTNPKIRKSEYQSDVVYVNNHELGFDWLRDYTCLHASQRMISHIVKDAAFILDEIDFILINEARIPYILSESGEEASHYYAKITPLLAVLREDIDYTKNKDGKDVYPTEEGNKKIEELLQRANIIKGSLFSPENTKFLHYINQGLKAHFAFQRNVDYIIKDKRIVTIDTDTGRPTPDRRYSAGLHQALEAKEMLEVLSESKTLAKITYSNFVKCFKKVSGMTGTASTEEQELGYFYNLDVLTVPTNKPSARIDHNDIIFKNNVDRKKYLLNLIKTRHEKGQPILIISMNVHSSEDLSVFLNNNNIPHEILNARNHAREAEIIEMAGQEGKITVSTAMAGRGTDIELGGKLKAIIRKAKESGRENDIPNIIEEHKKNKQHIESLGGLLVIGYGRHSIERTDNQSKGRCGRQGERGESIFLLSLQDELFATMMEKDANNNYVHIQGRLLEEAVSDPMGVSDPVLEKIVKWLQEMKRAYFFEGRKHQKEYGDVIDNPRLEINNLRDSILESNNVIKSVSIIFDEIIKKTLQKNNDIAKYLNKTSPETKGSLLEEKRNEVLSWLFKTNNEKIISSIFVRIQQQALKSMSYESLNEYLKVIIIKVLDNVFRDYISELEEKQKGIILSSYINKDPLHEYKQLSSELFETMLLDFKIELVRKICYTDFSSGIDYNNLDNNNFPAHEIINTDLFHKIEEDSLLENGENIESQIDEGYLKAQKSSSKPFISLDKISLNTDKKNIDNNLEELEIKELIQAVGKNFSPYSKDVDLEGAMKLIKEHPEMLNSIKEIIKNIPKPQRDFLFNKNNISNIMNDPNFTNEFMKHMSKNPQDNNKKKKL